MSYCTDHLSAGQRETIARSLYQVAEKRGDELHGLCPFHGEKKPSFSYNVVKDQCHCLSCGAGGDLIAIYGEVHGHADNDSAFKAFRDEFGTTPAPFAGGKPARARAAGGQGETPAVTKIIPEDDYQKLEDLDGANQQRCAGWGWSREVMDKIGLRQKGKAIAIPIRRDDGALVNIRLYTPGASDNKLMSWGKGYGKSKLFPAPARWNDQPIIICEGEKDCITALSKGFNACTQTAGCNSWDDKFTRYFSGRDVVIAYDADEKGITGAQKVAKKLGGTARSIKIITWPADIMPELEDHGQDLTDYFAQYGKTAQDLRDLIQQTDTVELKDKPASEPTGNARRFFGGRNGNQFKPRLVADEIMTWRQLVNDPRSGIMFSWNDRNWEEYDLGNIRRQVLAMLDTEGTTPRVNDVLGIVRDLAIMPHGRQMNDTPDNIPINSGVFSLKDGSISRHTPENYNSYVIDIDLDLAGDLPDCKLWLQFLADAVGDQDTIKELQKYFGLCLTRETRHEKALLLIGPGGDGKGTILKVLQALLGDHNVSNVTMGGLQDQFHRVMLVDKLLNVATEVEAGLLQSDIFKTLISGESVTAAFKHKNAFSFLPVCKLAFSSNKHPNIQDTSDGLYRRLLVIEMEKQFVKQGKADLYLYDKLLEERSGIFMWALRGLQLLREQGFTPSDYMQQCLDNFQEINNPILNFARTHVDEQPGNWICTMEAYRKYKQFCEKRGYKPLGESRFGVELKKVCSFASKKRETSGKRRWGYLNIGIIDDYVLDM